jgi:hypothetical protein
MALAGAGGGGFMYAITKEPNGGSRIKELLDESGLNMELYHASISNDGIDFNFI